MEEKMVIEIHCLCIFIIFKQEDSPNNINNKSNVNPFNTQNTLTVPGLPPRPTPTLSSDSKSRYPDEKDDEDYLF